MIEARLPGVDRGPVLPAEQFMVRLHEEIYRAERYGIPMSLVLADVRSASGERFLDFVAEQLRRIDMGTRLAAGRYAICLPHTSRLGAEGVGRRLRAALDGAVIGVVTCPQDGRTAEQLLDAADTLITVSSRTVRAARCTSYETSRQHPRRVL